MKPEHLDQQVWRAELISREKKENTNTCDIRSLESLSPEVHGDAPVTRLSVVILTNVC